MFRSRREHSPMRIADPFLIITHVIGSLREADAGRRHLLPRVSSTLQRENVN